VGLGRRVRTLVPTHQAPPGFAAAFPGVTAGRYASAGYDAMKAVLAALRRAGTRAQTRRDVIAAFRPPPPTPVSVRG
jgi:ABC-type branched-subunit amino acid transport system substrate-binding protein